MIVVAAACALFVVCVLLVARADRAAPAEPGARPRLLALGLLVVAACLTGVVARRHGVTHLLGFIPNERTEGQPSPRRPLFLTRPAGTTLAQDGVILLLDGLRVDAAEGSPAWKALAPRGARLRARVRYPVKSAASRSLLITGAPPEVSGVLGNTPSVRRDVDHLFARAAQAGLGLDLEHDWPEWLGLSPTPTTTPLASRRLTVRDWFECDHAGHAHGADSDEYRAAVAEVSDRLVAAVASHDLTRTVVLALADHGHVDRGGHLGLEPEVATAPVLLLGAGIRPGFARDEPVAMEDVGATLGVLLGLEPPDAARGVPVTAALELPVVEGAALEVAALLRKDDLARAWSWEASPRRAWTGRLALAGLALALALWLLRPPLDRRLELAALGPVLAVLAVWVQGPDVVSGELRWTVPALSAVALAGLVLSLVACGASGGALRAPRTRDEDDCSSTTSAARRKGRGSAPGARPRALSPIDGIVRATLGAWAVPVVLLLGRCGLSPDGLPPDPASYWLFAACGRLALVALVLLVGLLVGSISGANPRTHPLDEADRAPSS